MPEQTSRPIRLVVTADNHLNRYHAKMPVQRLEERRRRLRPAFRRAVDRAIEISAAGLRGIIAGRSRPLGQRPDRAARPPAPARRSAPAERVAEPGEQAVAVASARAEVRLLLPAQLGEPAQEFGLL